MSVLADDVDPTFPRYYLIPETTIDGPAFEPGTKVELRVEGTVATAPPYTSALLLRVDDWAGPRRASLDSGPIPEELLEACAARVSDVIAAHALDATEEPTARELAQAVLEEIGRRLRPSDSEAVSLALGVAKLDVEKLTKTGEEMAAILRGMAPDEPALRREHWAEVLATWQGQAHRDWSELHALRRAT